MKALCVQSRRTGGKEAVKYVSALMGEISTLDFDILVLPEKWSTSEYSEEDAEYPKLMDMFSAISSEHGCTVVPGSYSIWRDGKLFNSAPVFHDGRLLGYQDKISLFRSENGVYTSGRNINAFTAGSRKLAVAVCYDLDFPYFAKMAVERGSEMLVNPSLISSTFKDMWHIYVKGRSLETRLPVISVNSSSDMFMGGTIVTRMHPDNGGIMLEHEVMGNEHMKLMDTGEADLSGYRSSRQAEDPGIYALDSERHNSSMDR